MITSSACQGGDIEHPKMKVKLTPANGIRERFQKAILNKVCQGAFRVDLPNHRRLEADLNEGRAYYDDDDERTHQSKTCADATSTR